MYKIGIIAIISFMIFSCGAGKMGSTWTDEAIEVEAFNKILVIGNSPNPSVRCHFIRCCFQCFVRTRRLPGYQGHRSMDLWRYPILSRAGQQY